MTAKPELQPVKEISTLRGYQNLLSKENRTWWRTNRWWINAIVWTAAVCGLVSIMLFMMPNLPGMGEDPNAIAAGGPVAFGRQMGIQVFFEFGAVMFALGTIILTQDLIVQEKQSGVIEWLLAKPVTRGSYLLAKLAGSLIGIMVLVVGLPSLISYFLFGLQTGEYLPLIPYLTGVGSLASHTIFYLTLTLMLGAYFSSSTPILAVSIGILFGGNLLVGAFQPLMNATPWLIGKLANLANTQAIPLNALLAPTLATLAWSVLFTIAGTRIINRKEF